MAEYEGRLELTWTNKHKRLLAHEDGRYEWLPPADYRVAEVRLLHDAGTVGQVADDRASDNLLIRGDALNALTSLIGLPEFAREYVGKVRLAYLDPPFNTQQSFLQYDDALEHSVWLTMMRDRLTQVKTLLADDGCVYVHCDSSEGHYLKVLLDEVFERANFRSEIIWKRTSAHSSAKRYGPVHDTILFYSKTASFFWNPIYQQYDAEYVDTFFDQVDGDGRRWRRSDLTGAGVRSGATGQLWRGIDVTAKGRHWAYPPAVLDELDANGQIHWPKKEGGMPRLKQYPEDLAGVPLQDVWTDIRPMHNLSGERTGYATQKPEPLLQRILAASTNPGDIVLDCFLGSGTTAAVAHKMGRRWVGVERERATVEQYALPRLRKVVAGDDPGGVTTEAGWLGGGGFRVLDVAPSMFDEAGGQVYLADWATGGRLAEATAAQLGFEHAPDPPFAGYKGRQRLAVIDGLVNEDVVRLLLDALGPDEQLLVCGTALDPAVSATLRELLPGSSARKIPQSILAEYQLASRWSVPAPAAEADGQPPRQLRLGPALTAGRQLALTDADGGDG